MVGMRHVPHKAVVFGGMDKKSMSLPSGLSAVQNGLMDEIVKQAQIKWPNVPACYGWLGLDARGRWYLRDEAAQASGKFDTHKGSQLAHEKLIGFIGRNYEKDAEGQWFFQNGPQRVYVELECTPWVWRLDPDGSMHSHTGQEVTATRCLVDETGKVYLVTELGVGLVHSQDVGLAAFQIEKGVWAAEAVMSGVLEQVFGYVRSPQHRQQQTKRGRWAE